jgi:hypothetical protein
MFMADCFFGAMAQMMLMRTAFVFVTKEPVVERRGWFGMNEHTAPPLARIGLRCKVTCPLG